MVDHMQRMLDESRRRQDKQERAQYEVYDRLWETEEALSSRVRFFAVGVLAVSWGLLVQETGPDSTSLFDMRLVLSSALLAVGSLVSDFLYFTFRRGALWHAARHGTRQLDGSGPNVRWASLAAGLRVALFVLSAFLLVFAAVTALLPVVMNPAPPFDQ